MTLIASSALLLACGGSSNSGGGGGGGCPPVASATITITNTGVAPKVVCVLPNGTVTFTNSDTAPHDIESSTAACTELNLGVIAASTSKTTAAFPVVEVCNFHDQTAPTNMAFQGTVVVTTVSPPGY